MMEERMERVDRMDSTVKGQSAREERINTRSIQFAYFWEAHSIKMYFLRCCKII
jgi:hypothetical protein